MVRCGNIQSTPETKIVFGPVQKKQGIGMTIYRLHTSPGGDGVPFSTFTLFFRAMQTSCTPERVQHYSLVTFRFTDQTQTEYRLHCEPLHTWQQIDTPVEVLSCPERPDACIKTYSPIISTRKPPSRTTRGNTFATIQETELAERWVYTYPGRTYILSKQATAATKELASQVEPVFGIAIDSPDRQCVYDLLGRFTNGQADELHIVSHTDTEYERNSSS